LNIEDMMTDTDTSPEAVERLADSYVLPGMPEDCRPVVTASTLRALAARLEAAEAQLATARAYAKELDHFAGYCHYGDSGAQLYHPEAVTLQSLVSALIDHPTPPHDRDRALVRRALGHAVSLSDAMADDWRAKPEWQTLAPVYEASARRVSAAIRAAKGDAAILDQIVKGQAND
jgi:hypothetical protein